MSFRDKGMLKIGSHNIKGGISRKLDSSDVRELVEQFDIFSFQETWLVGSSTLSLKGYELLRSDRGKHNGSGGVCTIYKSNLKSGIQKLGSSIRDFLWIKLDSTFFGTEKDTYLDVISHLKPLIPTNN